MNKKNTSTNEEIKYNNKNILAQKKRINNGLRLIQQTFLNDKIFVNYNINKIPLTPNSNKLAKANDVTTWTSFNNALKGLKLSHVIGIGIELGKTSKGNLCCIDIDNCINKNGKIHPKAKKIIDLFDSYTELSISKKGLHILVFAKKNGNKCKISNLDFCEHLEIYDNWHYVALTGIVINNKKIENRQNALNKLYSEYFQCSESKNTSATVKFKEFSLEKLEEYDKHFQKALKLDSKLSTYYYGKRPFNDESANDLGFCIKLAYWLNNATLIEKYFLNSPYFSQKDEKHKAKCLNRLDYLNRTISCALRRV